MTEEQLSSLDKRVSILEVKVAQQGEGLGTILNKLDEARELLIQVVAEHKSGKEQLKEMKETLKENIRELKETDKELKEIDKETNKVVVDLSIKQKLIYGAIAGGGGAAATLLLKLFGVG